MEKWGGGVGCFNITIHFLGRAVECILKCYGNLIDHKSVKEAGGGCPVVCSPKNVIKLS